VIGIACCMCSECGVLSTKAQQLCVLSVGFKMVQPTAAYVVISASPNTKHVRWREIRPNHGPRLLRHDVSATCLESLLLKFCTVDHLLESRQISFR